MGNLNSSNKQKKSFKIRIEEWKDKISSHNEYYIIKLYLLWDLFLVLLVGSGVIAYQYIKNPEFMYHLTEHVKLTFVIWFILMVCRNILGNLKIKFLPYSFSKEFFKLLDNALTDSKSTIKKTANQRLLETTYFLKASNARAGKGLEFIPDNPSIDNLHKIDGLIALTQAKPSEWLNPTYNFYLINDYITNFYRCFDNYPNPKTIKLTEDRSHKIFENFCKQKKEILKEISELTETNTLNKFLKQKKYSIRFYFTTKEEINQNKSIIETLIAGHDLFGCLLYFVNLKNINFKDEKSNDNRYFTHFRENIGYDLKDNNDRIDLAVVSLNELNAIFRKEDDLVQKIMEDVDIMNFQRYIVKLCRKLHGEYDDEDYLLNKYIFESDEFVLNKNFCHLYVSNP
jgi:hypothetical protein